MSELTVQLRAAAAEVAMSKILDIPDVEDEVIAHIERALEIIETPQPESGPGFAHFTASDTPADIERKMADAFAPLRAMRWALHPNYRRRDEHGRFLAR